jgi:hypothetical protein
VSFMPLGLSTLVAFCRVKVMKSSMLSCNTVQSKTRLPLTSSCSRRKKIIASEIAYSLIIKSITLKPFKRSSAILTVATDSCRIVYHCFFAIAPCISKEECSVSRHGPMYFDTAALMMLSATLRSDINATLSSSVTNVDFRGGRKCFSVRRRI